MSQDFPEMKYLHAIPPLFTTFAPHRGKYKLTY